MVGNSIIMKRIKAVVCDLDGTLLNEQHTISTFTKETIKKIVDSGVKFIIATGRHHRDAIVFKEMLGLKSFMITSNGSKVHDYDNNEIISHNIPLDISTELLEYEYNEKLHKNVYIDEKWFAERELPEAKEFHKESGFTYEIASFKSLIGKEITKFFYLSRDIKIIEELEKELKERFKRGVSVTLSLDCCVEIMKENITKAYSLKEVLDREGIDLSEAVAFGDGLNDLEMLASVGNGYIMGNGSERLKEQLPNNEVILSNDEDGVAKKLREIFELER